MTVTLTTLHAATLSMYTGIGRVLSASMINITCNPLAATPRNVHIGSSNTGDYSNRRQQYNVILFLIIIEHCFQAFRRHNGN